VPQALRERLRHRFDRPGIVAVGEHGVERVEQEVGARPRADVLELVPEGERLGLEGADLGGVPAAHERRARPDAAPGDEHAERERGAARDLGPGGRRQAEGGARGQQHETDQNGREDQKGREPNKSGHTRRHEPATLERQAVDRAGREEAAGDLERDEAGRIGRREGRGEQQIDGKRGPPEPAVGDPEEPVPAGGRQRGMSVR